MICHYQVAECTFFFIYRESFATQSDFCVVLSARIYFQLDHSVYGIDIYTASKYGCIKVDVNISEQVVAFTFELWVRSYLEGDVKVSVRSSVAAFLAVAFQFYSPWPFSFIICPSAIPAGMVIRRFSPFTLKVCLCVTAASRSERLICASMSPPRLIIL